MIGLGKLTSVTLILVLLLVGCKNMQRQQSELAESLGVVVQDYPPQYYFPLGYFDSVLETGMTVDQVHNVVQGYEKVLSCTKRGYVSEVYYYFGKEDNNALRFEIVYNEQKRFTRLVGEDEDSRTILTSGCIPGLITDEN